jgi:site-specific recombinase XerD
MHPSSEPFSSIWNRRAATAPRSRNVRRAAVQAFFRYVALYAPDHSALAQRVLAIPPKRFERTPIGFLTRPEVEALLNAPDQTTWIGRRDRTLLLLAAQTGLRVSELVGLCCQDIVLGHGAHVRCLGKGRKARYVLRHSAAMDLLQHGVDSTVIALWRGHESVETTQIYLHADMQMKEKALEKTSLTNVLISRYQPEDPLLAFLEGL